MGVSVYQFMQLDIAWTVMTHSALPHGISESMNEEKTMIKGYIFMLVFKENCVVNVTPTLLFLGDPHK